MVELFRNRGEGPPPGRYVVPVDVTYGGRALGPFREALVDVGLPGTHGDG